MKEPRATPDQAWRHQANRGLKANLLVKPLLLSAVGAKAVNSARQCPAATVGM